MTRLVNLVLKSVIYRCYSIVIAFVVFYIITGEAKIASGLTMTIEIVKVIQYTIFEVLWRNQANLRKREHVAVTDEE